MEFPQALRNSIVYDYLFKGQCFSIVYLIPFRQNGGKVVAASELLSDSSMEMLYIVPYQEKWDPNYPQPAFSLQMEAIKVWPSTGRLSSNIVSHFVCTNVRHISRGTSHFSAAL